jgi:hypothetical protein
MITMILLIIKTLDDAEIELIQSLSHMSIILIWINLIFFK